MSSIARPLTRGLPLGWVAVVVVVALLAAGGAWAWARAGAADGLGAAREASARAAAAEVAAAEVSEDLAALERRLGAATEGNERLANRMERATEALWSSLRNLRGELAAARAGSKEALAGVGAAAAEAHAAAKQLSVLEDRFEYHLRADHGGG
jgi:hypothetical protein